MRAVAAPNGTTGVAYYATSTILGFGAHGGHWGIEGEVPFAISVTSSQGKTTTWGAVGNGAVGLYYAFTLPKLRIEVGGVLGLPTESADDAARGVDARVGAVASRGYDRVWLWAPTTGTLAPVLRIGSKENDTLTHHGEAVVAPLFSPRGAELAIQISEDVGAQIAMFHVGAKAELVVYANGAGSVKALSLTPHAGIQGSAGFVDIGFLMNITGPAAFSFDEGKYWGLNVRADARF